MPRKSQFKDISGHRFGRLLVLNPCEPYITCCTKFTCVCDCGNFKDIVGRSLTKGFTQSCGCLHKERTKAANTTHGGTSKDKSEISVLWSTFAGMMSRCYNPKSHSYHNYGGRGIEVCDRWHSFKMFVQDMGFRVEGDRISLERVDNDNGYSPDNCVWADAYTQANNRRCNKVIEVNGVSKTGPEWGREYGVPYHTIRGRLKLGWPPEDAVTIPAGVHRRYRVMLTVNGVTKSITEWSKEYNISNAAIRARLKRGLSETEAVTTPLLKYQNRN